MSTLDDIRSKVAQYQPPKPLTESLGHLLVLLSVLAAILALNLDFVLAVWRILSDPDFLSGFALMVGQVAVVSILGSAIGVILAAAVLRSPGLTQSAIAFLRLGIWLPFFAAWALPTWWIHWGSVLGVPVPVEKILRVAIPTLPTGILAACYYYLSVRYMLQLRRRTALFTTLRSTVLHALIFIFLAQVFLYSDGWEWSTGFQDFHSMARPSATWLLVGGLLFLIFPLTSTFDKTAEMTSVSSIRQIRRLHWGSCFEAALLWCLCFAIWDASSIFLAHIIAIAPLRDVIRAGYRLLVTGSRVANMDASLWSNLAVSSQEIGEGLLLTAVLAFVVVKVVEGAAGTIRLSWTFAFTHSLLVVLAISLTPWLGKGHWLKAVIVAATSFFPFVEILWGFRRAPLVLRILLALDNAIPYAFLGMLFGELWAASSGLGFLTIVARAAGNRAEALASALITLGLMVSVSFVLELSIKWLVSSEPELTQIL